LHQQHPSHLDTPRGERWLENEHVGGLPRALLDENPDPTEHEIRTAISGAICRCTGYKNIVAAVRWAADHEAATANRGA